MSKKNKILRRIIEKTRMDLEKRKRQAFDGSRFTSFSRTIKTARFAIIGEIKFAAPSEGVLGSPSDFLERIKEYEKAGVNAISIVTEKHFFKGDLSFVVKAKQISKLPILQKDFVIDAYQIYEAKRAGADAVLLIAKIVSKEELIMFVKLAKGIGIEPVVEINDDLDLKKALATETKIIAVNARDLDTFEVDVDKACLLFGQIPGKYIRLGFSGVRSVIEVEKYKKNGADGVLIGTSLMRAKNLRGFLLSLRSRQRREKQARSSLKEIATPRESGARDDNKEKLNVRVKICGIRSLEAALAAVEAGADFLGFNFVPSSKRYINPLEAKKIIELLGIRHSGKPKAHPESQSGFDSGQARMTGFRVDYKAKTVGVFQNQPIEYVNNVAKKLNLEFVQLHGEESVEYCRQVQAEVIKVISLPANFSIDKTIDVMRSYGVPLYLIDRERQGRGKRIDSKKAKAIAEKFPIIFAGGLTIETVKSIRNKVRPYAVDVASGIETNGKQDVEKIRQFIKNAKGLK